MYMYAVFLFELGSIGTLDMGIFALRFDLLGVSVPQRVWYRKYVHTPTLHSRLRNRYLNLCIRCWGNEIILFCIKTY